MHCGRQSTPPHHRVTPTHIMRSAAGPVTLSFGCHCHPASASLPTPISAGLARGHGYTGGRRVEVTSQRGSWEQSGMLPRNHSKKIREERRWRESEHYEMSLRAFSNPHETDN